MWGLGTGQEPRSAHKQGMGATPTKGLVPNTKLLPKEGKREQKQRNVEETTVLTAKRVSCLQNSNR